MERVVNSIFSIGRDDTDSVRALFWKELAFCEVQVDCGRVAMLSAHMDHLGEGHVVEDASKPGADLCGTHIYVTFGGREVESDETVPASSEMCKLARLPEPLLMSECLEDPDVVAFWQSEDGACTFLSWEERA
jgi:hypothetical protein